jgi:hypothetical protein
MGAHALIEPRRSVAIKASFLALVLAASLFALARANATAATAYSTVQPGSFTGSAFDACTAPPAASMTAWKASPYKAIGIYIGGVSRGCTQANLTAAWVQQQVTAGWKLLPLYVGPQASCSGKKNLINNATADAQGRAAGSDAVVQAAALGLAKTSVLIYDMEAYPTTDAACRTGVLAFMNGYTSQLHDLGYYSGYYSSVGSGIAHQVANYSATGYARPDYVDFARWDGAAGTVTDTTIPSTMWPGKRRMKQYLGGHQETWGGVTINVDSNYVDFAPLPAPQMADFTGNGWSDVLAKTASTGNLFLYPGNGATVSEAGRRNIGAAWTSMNAIVRIGDLNRDGREDVVARQTNGDLWLYPGTGSGLGARKKIATKWSGYREITAVGDFNRDGYPDLVAASGSNLYLFPGKSGAALGARVLLSKPGWTGMYELAGIGDLTKDGNPDLVARDGYGALWLFPGKKTSLGGRTRIGTGWGGFRDLVGVGDFDRDGTVDMVAVAKSTNALWLFAGGNGTLKIRTQIGSMSGRTPLA